MTDKFMEISLLVFIWVCFGLMLASIIEGIIAGNLLMIGYAILLGMCGGIGIISREFFK